MFISKKSLKDEVANQLKKRKKVYAVTIHLENELCGTSQWYIYATKKKAEWIINFIKSYWYSQGKVVSESADGNVIVVKDNLNRDTRIEFVLEKFERKRAA